MAQPGYRVTVNDVKHVSQSGVPTPSWIDSAIPNGSPKNVDGIVAWKFCGWLGLRAPVRAFSFTCRYVSAFVVFSTTLVSTAEDCARVVPLFLLPPTVWAATVIAATVETCVPLDGAVKRKSTAKVRPG